MKPFSVLCFLGVTFALPQKKLGNPDEESKHYQSDIRIPLPLTNKNGLLDESYRWEGGVVPFEYSSTFSSANKAVVQQAMDDYYSLTEGCIQFVPRSSESSYITFVNYDDGCWSYVGRQGGSQEINYAQNCFDQYGSIQHELYHALGFFHEESRPDRDDYVIIHYENIQTGTEGNFAKYPDTVVGTFGEDYDYGSVMHSSSFYLSASGLMTIETIDPTAQSVIGQRDGLSQTDLNKLMKMYNC